MPGMQNVIWGLLVLLGVQVLLVLFMYYPSAGEETARAGAVLDLGERTIDEVSIAAGDGAVVVLRRAGEDWVLPDAEDFPADGARVRRLLDDLAALDRGLPVATTADARQRFRVAEDDFERRIDLSAAGEVVGSLYLGSSSGAGSVHLRLAEESAIYDVEFGLFDAPAGQHEWLAQDILALDEDAIGSIDTGEVVLMRAAAEDPVAPGPEAGTDVDESIEAVVADATSSPPRWQIDGLADGERVNEVGADALVGSVARLRITGLLDAAPRLDAGAELTLRVTVDGDVREYRLAKVEDSEDYALRVSNRDETFEIAGWAGDALLNQAAREALVDAAN